MNNSQLLKYDGSDADGRICVAVNGKIFDVTRGKRFYGPGSYLYIICCPRQRLCVTIRAAETCLFSVGVYFTVQRRTLQEARSNSGFLTLQKWSIGNWILLFSLLQLVDFLLYAPTGFILLFLCRLWIILLHGLVLWIGHPCQIRNYLLIQKKSPSKKQKTAFCEDFFIIYGPF